MTTWQEHKQRHTLRGEAKIAYEASREQMGVGYLILQARGAVGVSQAQLADRIGTSQPTVARWESGAQLPSVRSLLRVAAATGFQLRVGLAHGNSPELVVTVRPGVTSSR